MKRKRTKTEPALWLMINPNLRKPIKDTIIWSTPEEAQELKKEGYVRLKDYKGSLIETGTRNPD